MDMQNFVLKECSALNIGLIIKTATPPYSQCKTLQLQYNNNRLIITYHHLTPALHQRPDPW